MTVPFLVVAPPASPVASAMQTTLLSNFSYDAENIAETGEVAGASDWASMLAAMLGLQAPAQIQPQQTPTEFAQPSVIPVDGNNVSFLTAYISQTVPANQVGEHGVASAPPHKQVSADDIPFLVVTPANVQVEMPKALANTPAFDVLLDKNKLATLPASTPVAPDQALQTPAQNIAPPPVANTVTPIQVLNVQAPATAPVITEDIIAPPPMADATLPINAPKAPEASVNIVADAQPALPKAPAAPAEDVQPVLQIVSNSAAKAAHAPIIIKIAQPEGKTITAVVRLLEATPEAPEGEEGLVSIINSARMKGDTAANVAATVSENIDAVVADEIVTLEAESDKPLLKTSTFGDTFLSLTNSAHTASTYGLAQRPLLHNPHILPATAQMAAAIQQLVADKDVSNASGAEKSITIQLDPPDLGRVHVKLKQDQDDRLHVHVVAERPETLALLQRDSQLLELSLGRQNLSGAANLEFSLDHNGSLFQGGAGEQQKHEGSAEQKAAAQIAVTEAEPSVYIDPITGLPRYDMLV